MDNSSGLLSYITSSVKSSTDNIPDVENKAAHVTTVTTAVFDLDTNNDTHISSAVDWSNPSDPANPYNWPLSTRIVNTVVPSLIALASTFVSSAYVPGILYIEAEMSVSREIAILGYAIFILGLAVGGPLIAPCSEVFGRKRIYLVSTPMFGLCIVGTAVAKSMTGVVLSRFLAGVVGSASLVVAAGTIADLWDVPQRALPTAGLVLMPFLGPALGPVIGIYVVMWRGWRWAAWVELLFLALTLTPTLFLRETSKRVILLRRAARLHIPGPTSPTDNQPLGKTISYFLTGTLVRPVHMLFTEPVVAAFSVWVAFNFALLYAFFCAFEYIFLVYYAFTPQATGLTFLGMGTGALAGFLIIVSLLPLAEKRAAAMRAQGKSPQPEQRLLVAMIGGPMIPISLFVFGWSVYNNVHWIVPVAAEAVFAAGNYLVFMSAVSYMVDTYGVTYGASAIGANTMLRYLLGSALPLVSLQLFENLGVQWASSLLGFLGLAMAGIPFVLFKFGPWLRGKSKYVRERDGTVTL